jgi:hypothetical protein
MPFCYCIRRTADITAIWKAGMVSWVWQVNRCLHGSGCRIALQDQHTWMVRPGRRAQCYWTRRTLLLQSRL